MQRRAADPDVLVIGGGPAGSVTAILLARAGVNVELIDRARFPRPKACGEFVNPGAIRLLNRIGLTESIAGSAANSISGWSLQTDGVPVAQGQYGAHSWGIGISRADFDLRLLDAAKACGVRVREGVLARSVQSGPSAVTTREAGGAAKRRRAEILVGADGLNSIVSRSLGGLTRQPRRAKLSLSAHLRGAGPDRQRGHMFVAEGLTVGLAATGHGELWNTTVVVDPQKAGRVVAADPARFLMDRLAHVALPWREAPVLVSGPWASGPFDRPVATLAGPDFVLVGDASGYFDPLTGQGIYRALRSAELAAPRIIAALEATGSRGEPLRDYEREMTKDRRAGRLVQHAVEHVMSSSPSRGWALRKLGMCAETLDALLRVTGDLESPATLVRPSVWLPLLAPRNDRLRRSA